MKRARSMAFALLISSACVWLLIGCFRYSDESSPAARVGEAKSNRPLRVTKNTRDQVLAYLGQPWFISANGRLVGYRWTRTVFVGCGSSGTDVSMVLLLGFDENDVLKSFRVTQDRPALRDEINPMLSPQDSLETPEQKT